MASFPKIIHDSVIAKYPITRVNRMRTEVAVFCDQSEQRWAKGVPLMTMDLTFSGVSTHDKDTLRTFWIERQGPLDTTWDIVFNGVTYIGCYFLPGPLEQVQSGPGNWSIRFRFKGRPAI